jgi:hypothetical protein
MGTNGEFYSGHGGVGCSDLERTSALRSMEAAGTQPPLWGLGRQAVEKEARLADVTPVEAGPIVEIEPLA